MQDSGPIALGEPFYKRSPKTYPWTNHPREFKDVKAAIDGVIVIISRATERVAVGDRTEVLINCISPDITGLIIGQDWLSLCGRVEWEFINGRIAAFESG